jgi:hypothetical protein
MAISITCPIEAQIVLRTKLLTYPPHGLGALVAAFMQTHKIPERKVRELALTHKLTITAVVRKLMVSKYPELLEVWPARAPTQAQLEGILSRTKSPDDGKLLKANTCLENLLRDPHNKRFQNTARVYLASQGIVVPQPYVEEHAAAAKTREAQED